MLICNNCSHVNEDGVVQCTHCHMRGNFTYSNTGERRSDDHFEEAESEQCLNCGSTAAGDGPDCAHCHFPLPQRQATAKHKIITVSAESRANGHFESPE